MKTKKNTSSPIPALTTIGGALAGLILGGPGGALFLGSLGFILGLNKLENESKRIDDLAQEKTERLFHEWKATKKPGEKSFDVSFTFPSDAPISLPVTRKFTIKED